MRYKCDIKIMAIPSRMQGVVTLCNKLGLSISDVAIDTEVSGCPLQTSQKAFYLAYADGVTHRLVLQDDLIVNPFLREAIQVLVNRFPSNPISLYTYKKKGGIENGVYKLHFLTAPALIMPKAIMEQIHIEYGNYPNFIHDDWFYSWFCRKHNITRYGIIPNLVTIDKKIESSLSHKVLPFYTDLDYTENRVDIGSLPDKRDVFCDDYINLSEKEFNKKLKECTR